MNLQNILEILAGGPGSGCNPAVADPRCGRPSGNSETRRGLYKSLRDIATTDKGRALANKAIEIMSRQRIDERLLSQPLTKFEHAKTESEWNVAVYNPPNSALYFYPRAGAVDIVHEVGHHVDYRWLKEAAQLRNASKIDINKAKQVMKSILDEYKDAKQKVLGEKDARKEWMTVSNKGIPSGYALYNKEEWFAESFTEYFKDNARLKRVAPRTHAALKTILEGKLFK